MAEAAFEILEAVLPVGPAVAMPIAAPMSVRPGYAVSAAIPEGRLWRYYTERLRAGYGDNGHGTHRAGFGDIGRGKTGGGASGEGAK